MKKVMIGTLGLTLLLTACQLNETKEGIGIRDSQKESEKEEIKEPYIPLTDKEVENIQYEVKVKGEIKQEAKNENQYFESAYTDMEGVLTFRGNQFRTSPSYGFVKKANELEEMYHFQTDHNPEWGGGAGWTGQASVIKWDEDVKQMMNIDEKFKQKKDFVEVVYASLDGHIYFFDLDTGEKTRERINIENPIKGSLSLDPRGYPLLYVGQGIPQKGEIGFRIFSLIDGELLHFTPGITGYVYRGWGAFDGSPLINRKTDTLFIAGENGVFYQMKLNTVFDKENKTISVTPEEIQYRYQIEGNNYQGVENSVAVYKNIGYFADNGGSVQGVNLITMKPIFALGSTDDTDATIVIDEEENLPYLYTGTEIDKQGKQGDVLIRKLHGVTGETVWEKKYPAFTVDGVNGGMLATPVVGKHDLSHLVVFTIARFGNINGGLMVALDKETGEEVWRKEMTNYSWSSPVDFYSEDKKGYILQGDSMGTLHLLDGKTGETITTLALNYNIEASPVIYKDTIVIATRGGIIHGIKIK